MLFYLTLDRIVAGVTLALDHRPQPQLSRHPMVHPPVLTAGDKLSVLATFPE
jgi:hypothetical protein